jgi:hypothetical protein
MGWYGWLRRRARPMQLSCGQKQTRSVQRVCASRRSVAHLMGAVFLLSMSVQAQARFMQHLRLK